MPSLFRRQTRAAGAARAEQDRLLSGVLQIFALIASADGPASAEREHYVQSYLESLNPGDTPRLLEEFKRYVAQNLPLDTTVAVHQLPNALLRIETLPPTELRMTPIQHDFTFVIVTPCPITLSSTST